MDYEHAPNPGPRLWIGAGIVLLVGGGSLLVVASGAIGFYLVGGVAALVGLVMFTFGLRRLYRHAPHDT